MKIVFLLLSLSLCAPAVFAETSPNRVVNGAVMPNHTQGGPKVMSQVSGKGAFVLEMVPGGDGLAIGPNSVDIVLRDRAGKEIEGAQMTVTPWMPNMGHGVWEKPLVQERGGGRYRVENIVLIMGGLWELKLDVKSGERADSCVFSFTVADVKSQQPAQEMPREGYDRSFADYSLPPVTLTNQDGKKVDLRTLVDSGKPVILDFIFTTCTTICPILSAGFSNLQRELGENASKVQLISISIDPENDVPQKLKSYQKRFNGRPGWEFLTGNRDDVGRVLRAFNAFVVDKMSHEPLYLLHAPNSTAQWVRIKGLIKKSDLMNEYHKIENW